MACGFIMQAMDDLTFLAQVEACALDPSLFNHAGHMRLARVCLQLHPVDAAAARCCRAIQRYAAHLGAADKFHWTVTEALVRLMAGGAADEVTRDARACLQRHYSAAVLAQPDARQRFVAPDLLPLPA
jgi:hypothetical protein